MLLQVTKEEEVKTRMCHDRNLEFSTKPNLPTNQSNNKPTGDTRQGD
jgi:hypothetical protein